MEHSDQIFVASESKMQEGIDFKAGAALFQIKPLEGNIGYEVACVEWQGKTSSEKEQLLADIEEAEGAGRFSEAARLKLKVRDLPDQYLPEIYAKHVLVGWELPMADRTWKTIVDRLLGGDAKYSVAAATKLLGSQLRINDLKFADWVSSKARDLKSFKEDWTFLGDTSPELPGGTV